MGYRQGKEPAGVLAEVYGSLDCTCLKPIRLIIPLLVIGLTPPSGDCRCAAGRGKFTKCTSNLRETLLFPNW